MQPVLHSFRYSVDFVVEQVADLSSDQMVMQPAGVVNHPAWTIGHLSQILELIGTVIGVEPTLENSWAHRYGPSTKPTNDRTIYEVKEESLKILRHAADRLSAAVVNLSDAKLDEPFPEAEYLDVFPTIRHALTQVLIGHTAYHVGQLSVWRKAMGLPAMKRSYE